jgi:siderophore synthetase component
VTLLTPSDYAAVRAALDISLTEAVLPDSVIELDVYLGAAEREVRAAVPDAESQVGENLERCRAAAILICAANLAPAIPRLQSERLADYTYQAQSVDWAKLAAALKERAKNELMAVTTTDTAEQASQFRHPVFGVAKGRRGTW